MNSNKKIKKFLDLGILKERPYLIQIAKNNEWEKCWKIDVNKARPEKNNISDYLDESSFDSLAFEALFKDKNSLTTIFTFGFNRKLTAGSELEFLSTLINKVWNYSGHQDFFDFLNKKLIGKENFLFSGDPDLIRIGVVNYWFSLGPCLIWEKGKPKKITKQDLDNSLKNKKHLVSNKLNYQGLAFIYDQNPMDLYYVIKPQCGEKKNGQYVLNKQKTLQLLKNMYDFEIN